MSFKVLVLSDAEHDIEEAFIWYESKKLGLGDAFYNSLNESVLFIVENPYSSREIFKNIRRLVIKKFPFGLYYKINSRRKEIQILGVIHFKRSPDVFQIRNKNSKK